MAAGAEDDATTYAGNGCGPCEEVAADRRCRKSGNNKIEIGARPLRPLFFPQSACCMTLASVCSFRGMSDGRRSSSCSFDSYPHEEMPFLPAQTPLVPSKLGLAGCGSRRRDSRNLGLMQRLNLGSNKRSWSEATSREAKEESAEELFNFRSSRFPHHHHGKARGIMRNEPPL